MVSAPLRTWTFFVLTAFATAASLRGLVGTDTFIYRLIIANRISFESGQPLLEPGFLRVVDLIARFQSDPSIIVNLISLVFFGMIGIFALRADRQELAYVLLYFAPQHFIMYSMNGLRIGLASSGFLLAFQSWRRHEWGRAVIAVAIGVSFHYTLVVAIVIFLLGRKIFGRWYHILGRILVVVGVAVFAVLAEAYVADRGARYLAAPDFSVSTSGISALIVLVLIPGARSLPIPVERWRAISVSLVVLVVGSLVFSWYSVAGLRLLDIVVWIGPLLYLTECDFEKTGRFRPFAISLGLAGFIGGMAVLRNLWSTAGRGISPFVPYHHLWS